MIDDYRELVCSLQEQLSIAIAYMYMYKSDHTAILEYLNKSGKLFNMNRSGFVCPKRGSRKNRDAVYSESSRN